MGLFGAGGDGFLNTIFTFILNTLIMFANLILEVLLAPVTGLIRLIFPSLDQAEVIFSNFLNTYAIPGITFARELFLNVTGYPRELLSLLAIIFAAKITYHIAVIPIKFLLRIFASVFHFTFGDPPSGGVGTT